MSSFAATCDQLLDGAPDTPEARDAAVRDVIRMGSIAAAAAAFQPVPLLDLVLISPIQIVMVQAIGRAHGHTLDRKAVLEILGTFGASLAAQHVVIAAAKLVPVAGWITSMSMAYALTWAVGEVAAHYFASGRGVPAEELRAMFRETYRAKRSEKEGEHGAGGTLKERLEQLREAHAAGAITREEFEALKARVLEGF